MVQLARPVPTPRLTLRRFERDDLDALALIFEDISVNRYLYSEPRDRDETYVTLERRLEREDAVTDDNLLNVAVELRETSRLIGDFMLRWKEDAHRQGEIGGSLHPDYHGQGYASEIYVALIELAFSSFGLHRVVGRCDARNAASIRSLEKSGLRREAHFIENEFVKGEWTDEMVLAIRASEWAAL
ncbi:MAG TPA: GNAT family N-acetyltransferase [Acidimicrobiales bacterium]|jgi:RimJ/RimL family protein N-acetyltransferase|nr:GNAT family N-acetyltransferase [Acidimicrobiales bacterium]